MEFEIKNLNGDSITILGHGGMGVNSIYPLNSFESIFLSLNMDSDGAEFDIQMTKDSVLVLYHDHNLSSKTNQEGVINELYWNEVKNAQYTTTPYLNYKVISLEQLFSNIDNIKDYKFAFDCKLYANPTNAQQYFEAFSNAIIAIMDKYQIVDNVYIEAPSTEFLSLLKTKKPESKLLIYPSSFDAGLDIALSLDLYGIAISTRKITKEQIEIAHSNGVKVSLFNVHSPSDNKEAIEKHPDIIQTESLSNLIRLLK